MNRTAELDGRTMPVDLRTPMSTYDAFCRSILWSQPDQLWVTVHPELKLLMQRQYYQLGESCFLGKLRELVVGSGERLRLGPPELITARTVCCPLLRAGHQVGKARFSLGEEGWLLFSLN